MKQSEVRVGAVYQVKVSGKLAPVRIIREVERRVGFTRTVRTQWVGKNLRTGREITIRSAAKLRREIQEPRQLPATQPQDGIRFAPVTIQAVDVAIPPATIIGCSGLEALAALLS